MQRQKKNLDHINIWCDHPSSRDTCTQLLKAGRLNAAPDRSRNLCHATGQLGSKTQQLGCREVAAAECEYETFGCSRRPAGERRRSGSVQATVKHGQGSWWDLFPCQRLWLFGCNSSMETTSGHTPPDSRWCVWVTLVYASCELEALLNIF